MTGRVILTAAEMRAAEEAAIAAGTPVEELMERAGKAAAEAIWRYAGPLPALVLCGPGNNGGDGRVIARELAARGMAVRLASLGDLGGEPAPLLIDALFGTGLSRPLAGEVARRLNDLAAAAQVRVAIDLPSGVATDDGAILSAVPDYDLTITFQTLKPSHLLQPAARHMGRIVVADIGIPAAGKLAEIGRPRLRSPGPDDHKYRRGYLLVVGGAMPGAAALAASAAARSGAGYVVLAGDGGAVPNAIVRRSPAELATLLADKRLNAVLVGPGLGRDPEAWDKLSCVMASPHPVIVDGDALWLIAEMGAPWKRSATTIATPHAGEFGHVYGDEGDKVSATRAAAVRTGDVIVFKGADTVLAAPDGRAAIAPGAPHWLASAGTGDVLAGVIAARLASGLDGFEAACAGTWLHGRAAALAGPALIADDLIARLPAAVAECL